jgi:hypothetical protein
VEVAANTEAVPKKTLAQLVAEALTDKTDRVVTKAVEEVVIKQTEEERDNRKNNVIICHVPESKSSELLDRRKQVAEFVQKLCSDALEIKWDNQDTELIYQLGKKRQGRAPQPLLVRCKNENKKNEMMKNVKSCLRHLSVLTK